MTLPKILQQTFNGNKITNGIRKKTLPSRMMIFNWIFMGLLLFLQFNTYEAAKYKGDGCESKSQPGICKGWSECPEIKTLIDRGEYTNQEVVTCGFGIREELICCPVIKADTKIGTNITDDKDRFVTLSTTTTTPIPQRDFWMDLLDNINKTTTTTVAPDFWQDLLTTSTTTTTITTTSRPLMVGDLKLNESSEFFDLNALLSGSQKRQKNSASTQNTGIAAFNSQNVGFNKNNNRGFNLNRGPVNNQLNFEQSPNNQRGNNGRNQLNNVQQNSFRGNGQINNVNNGRGGSNRNFVQNNDQNRGFNNFNNGPTPRPNMPLTNANDQQNLNELIEDIFTTDSGNKQNPIEQKNKLPEQNLDKLIENIFETPKTEITQNDFRFPKQNTKSTQSFQFPNNQREFINSPQQNALMKQFHNFEPEPSTNFIRQPVVVETWPDNPGHTPEFDPIQKVYHNLVNSGMNIVKVEADQFQNGWNQQQQQFGNRPQAQFGQVVQQPLQQFVKQSNANQFAEQQFVQLPKTSQSNGNQFAQQQFVQLPQTSQSNGNQFAQQQFVQLPQTSQLMPSQFQQQQSLQSEEQNPEEVGSVQQPSSININIQSPPKNILDPFKPFQFRPPPQDEVNNSLSPTEKPTGQPNNDRPAVRACRRIESGLKAGLSQHILGGTPVELGELPHMAGIGYSRIGNDGGPPYDIRCGGTLIHKRFVLTAAHCVSDRTNVPEIVRLGVVNNTAGDHMQRAVELGIKQTFIHEEYSTRATYNDIAILELEREVQTNDIIYPVCLYSDIKDPDPNIRLWVSGWGTINRTTRSFSNILLKAPLQVAPLESCNQSYVEYGLTRAISEGVRRTQLCATDKDQIKDSCQGDSGGPLHLIVDETLRNYRLVGVVSTGFSCASTTPGLYTRVAAFLDFIERIVWPNGGDD